MKQKGSKKIKRALLSVSDKTGLIDLAQGLREFGVEIISTGGTAQLLHENGIPVREVAAFTGFPEILGGRVKTLHPKVHGGILLKRHDKRHVSQARRLGIEPIDLVVVNLYPFEEKAAQKGISFDELIEEIDIGGVALLRAAAKNCASVAVVSQPSQYAGIFSEMNQSKGSLSAKTRFSLAVAAFSETAYLDSVIHSVLSHRGHDRGGGSGAASASRSHDRGGGSGAASDSRSHDRGGGSGAASDSRSQWGEHLVLGLRRQQMLRYGENPHQAGAWYVYPRVSAGVFQGLAAGEQLHGKGLSFNNLLDMDAALAVVAAFQRPCAAVIKHVNPCGVACADTLPTAFTSAFSCDPLSAFGGIVGLNRSVDATTAAAIAKSGFLECLVAPGFSPQALRILRVKKNLRIVRVPRWKPEEPIRCVDLKQISGGLLLQEPDESAKGPKGWRRATTVWASPERMKDLFFAWKVSKFVRSNAVVVVKKETTVGIGAGQPSRVDSVYTALAKAGKRSRGAVLASDGFFPKPDGPAAAVKAGIAAIVQPGGSIQDPEVIRVAQKARVPMYLTGERHFRH